MPELRLLTDSQLRQIYRVHVKRDFPRSERRPFTSIRSLRRAGRYDTWGVFEGDALLAYAFLWRTAEGNCALLDYLAVCPEGRGQGLGTQALELLKARYGPACTLLAEAEAPEPGISPEEDRVRRRRLAFYQRAGFRLMTYQADIFHVRYAMLVWSESCVLDEETLQNTHRGLYQSQMPPVLFRRMIHIPAAHCGKKE